VSVVPIDPWSELDGNWIVGSGVKEVGLNM
jgi:hypothetical protein